MALLLCSQGTHEWNSDGDRPQGRRCHAATTSTPMHKHGPGRRLPSAPGRLMQSGPDHCIMRRLCLSRQVCCTERFPSHHLSLKMPQKIQSSQHFHHSAHQCTLAAAAGMLMHDSSYSWKCAMQTHCPVSPGLKQLWLSAGSSCLYFSASLQVHEHLLLAAALQRCIGCIRGRFLYGSFRAFE